MAAAAAAALQRQSIDGAASENFFARPEVKIARARHFPGSCAAYAVYVFKYIILSRTRIIRLVLARARGIR